MNAKEFNLIVSVPIKVRVSNDSIGHVKEQEAISKVEAWVKEGLGLNPGCELDLTSYGEFEVFDLGIINAEVI